MQYHAANNIFENNVVYSTAQDLFLNNYTTSAAPVSLNYNIYDSAAPSTSAQFIWLGQTYTGFSTYQANSGQDAQSKFTNPLFVSPTTPNPTLSVQSGSPAIGAGNTLSSLPCSTTSGETGSYWGCPIVGTLDFSGNPREVNGLIDIGAFEFGSASGTPPAIPGVVTNLTATVNDSAPSVTLSCTEPVGSTVSSNSFYRSTTSGSGYALIGSNSACSFTDTTVAYSTIYYYVATAVNSSGAGPQSNQATAVVGAAPVVVTPNTPTALTVSSISGRDVTLVWTAPVPQAGVTVSSYNVYSCRNSTCSNPREVSSGVTGTTATERCDHTCYYEVQANDIVSGTSEVTGPSNIVEVSN